jgi:hypothetical protein
MPPPKDPIKYEEMRRRQSEAAKKRCDNPEWHKKASEMGKRSSPPLKGKHHTEESKQKMRERKINCVPWNKGLTCPDVDGKRSGDNHWTHRMKISEETRLKRSVALKGKKLPPRTKEYCEKMSESKKRQYVETPELCKKLSKIRKGRFCGENHPNWQGGLSFGKYCKLFNSRFKERQRAYMGYVCLLCGSPQNGVKHIPHHVNYDKMMCCSDVKPLFVTLCRSCHSKTNFNREYWEEYFTEIIESYYQGKTFFTEEEMVAWESVN